MLDRQSQDWKLEFRNLSKKAAAAEKDFPRLFSLLQTSQHKLKVDKLIEEAEERAADRVEEQQRIFKGIKEVKGGIDGLKDLLKFYEKKNEYLVKVQTHLEKVVSSMDGFKEQMAAKYEECADIEETLTKDVQLLDKKVTQYQQGEYVKEEVIVEVKSRKQNLRTNGQGPSPAIEGTLQGKISVLHQKMRIKTLQIEEAQGNLRALGKNYGWPEQDHNDFLAIYNRRRNNNYFQIEEECQRVLKMYTQEQVHTHLDKHLKYVALMQQKKELLYAYSMLKKEKKELELKALQQQETQQRKKADQFKQQNVQNAEAQQRQRKQRMLHWNLMKEAKKQIQQQKKRQQQQRRKEQEMRRRAQNQAKREMVHQWKQVVADSKREIPAPARPRSAVPTQTANKIREREELMVQKRVQGIKKKQMQMMDKAKKEQELKQRKFIKFSHVSSKLDEKTAAIKEKQRQKFDGKNPREASTFGGVIGVGHARAVPSWRQNL